MKIGFFHDSPMIEQDGKFYSRTLTKDVWNRYLTIFDELQVSTRITRNNVGGETLSNTDGVSFQPISKYTGGLALVRNFPAVVKQIRQALLQVDGAIVRLPSVIGWLTFAIATLMKKPILIELVGCPWDAYRMHSTGGKVFAPFAYIFTRLSLNRAKFVIYVTQEFLQKRYPTKGNSVGISNVNVDVFEDHLTQRLASFDHLRSILQSGQGSIRIGSIGMVDLPYKGFESAIRAVKVLANSNLDVRLEIVGPGDSGVLNGLIQELELVEHVRLKGPMPSVEVHKWLEDIDFYIQPSFTEGVSRASIEALSKGLPMVLSAVGGQPELVDSNHLFKAGDFEMLAGRISKILKTEDLDEVAKRNFNRSKMYSNSILQRKREEMLRSFSDSIIE